MKNIYEDANSRSDMHDIGSGDTEKENIESASAVNHRPVSRINNTNQQSPSQAPQLQLTQEQIAALLSQLLNTPQVSAPAQPQPEIPAEPKEPSSHLDSGKRILYQSPDFDETSKEQKPIGLPSAKIDEQLKRSFYDDDEIFDSEEVSREGLRSASNMPNIPSRVKTTTLGRSFSVDEIEYSNNELPDVMPAKIASKKLADDSINIQKPSFESMNENSVVDKSEEEVTLPINKTASTQIKGVSYPTIEKRNFVPSIEIEEVEIGTVDSKSANKKKISTAELVRRIVLAISLVAMVIAAAFLVKEFILHKENQDLEDDVKDLIVDVVETTKVKKKDQKEDDKKETTKSSDDTEATTALTPEQQWAEIRAEFPNVIFPPNIQLKYARLYATNQDFVGYLSADGANLNLPIVQTDDDEKYMTKNFYGKTTKYGCPFVTHINKIDNLDTNTVIFGHHMNDGTVFGALDNYKTIDGFKKAPVITFNTLYKDYQWKVIAAFITNAYEAEDNGYVFKYYFASLSTQERFSAYLNELSQRSLYDTGVDVLPTDKLLTLSTCSHEFNEARMVVVARLVRPGESVDVDVEKATVNSNPRYPQAYYTKKKQSNPYADASRWEVG